MVVCLETNGVIYNFLVAMSNNVTGSIFLSTLVVSLFLIVIAVAFFRIPIEFAMIILLCVHIAFLACIGSDWLPIVGTILIYLGVLFGKNFFFR